MEIRTKPKRWGNSIEVIMPKKVLRDLNINLDTEISIEIKKENLLKRCLVLLKLGR